ncbi:MAG: hypothetical protein FWF47_04005, partial [Clostridia bacterium]|nr:hypothetical protein [Clostridia bacterium]
RGKLMKAEGENDALSGQVDALSAQVEATNKKLEDTEAAAAGNRAAQKDLQTGLEKRVAQLNAELKARENLLKLADRIFNEALATETDEALVSRLYQEYAAARGIAE